MGFLVDLFATATRSFASPTPAEYTRDLDAIMRDTALVKEGKLSKAEFYRRIDSGRYK